ncbi:hypothetical protein PR202_gb21636 [Eleusine coracana subsp. coracana]|uniref:Secreted protein n=1 Tax=Eleusine coracana subsp. coracana TaxID=191504 RepID=A0AAV5FBL9_ELECO|nr:hypothetical protein PR202_gb21636 [Eleusine coracana subsp. coracana]
MLIVGRGSDLTFKSNLKLLIFLVFPGLTHTHLYLHGTSSGPNARTTARTARRPGSWTGSRASSSAGSAGYLTSFTLVFTAGDHTGSTLSVQGPVLN